jgi:hypothetical protein
MATKTKIISVILALAFLISGQAFASTSTWSDVSGPGGKKGLISEKKGAETNIAVSESGRVYAAFQDKRERVYASYFNGATWTKLVGENGADYVALNGDKPALAAKGDNLYIAYKDLDADRKAKVKKWDGSAWSDLVDANHPQGYISDLGGFEPVLCFDKSGEYLYAAFRDETSGEKIKVMRWNDISGWSDVSDENNSGGLISSAVASETDIKASKNSDDIFVAFEDLANGGRIRVKKWDGTVWSDLSDESHPAGLASPIAGYSPSIDTDAEGNLYLVYTGKNEKNTYIQKWNGSNWENIGDGMAVQGKTIESTIAIDGRGYLYLAYSQKTKSGWRVRAKILRGSLWLDAKDGKSQNISRGKGKGDPSLATFENRLYMSFSDARNKSKARVKMLNFQP